MKETKKQLRYIKFIQEETRNEYTGNTATEASKYISENVKNVSPMLNNWALVNGY